MFKKVQKQAIIYATGVIQKLLMRDRIKWLANASNVL